MIRGNSCQAACTEIPISTRQSNANLGSVPYFSVTLAKSVCMLPPEVWRTIHHFDSEAPKGPLKCRRRYHEWNHCRAIRIRTMNETTGIELPRSLLARSDKTAMLVISIMLAQWMRQLLGIEDRSCHKERWGVELGPRTLWLLTIYQAASKHAPRSTSHSLARFGMVAGDGHAWATRYSSNRP